MRSLTALDCWVRQLNRSITGISSNWHVNLSMHVKANSVKTSTCRHSCNSVLLIHISEWLISLEWFYALSTFQERISSFTGGFDLVRILRWASNFEILLYRSIITCQNRLNSILLHEKNAAKSQNEFISVWRTVEAKKKEHAGIKRNDIRNGWQNSLFAMLSHE